MTPQLVIFDIDSTLIEPLYYHTDEQVLQGLYDPTLLTLFLTDSSYQVALASFNQGAPWQPYAGRPLGRLILDLQHPTGNSRECVEEDFIQAWRFQTIQEMRTRGKNDHIRLILQAYHNKYGHYPPSTLFYDDCIENVYLANKSGVHALWVTTGLTKNNIHTFGQISNRIVFNILFGQLPVECLQELTRYIYKDADNQNRYILYLPSQNMYSEFIVCVYRSGIIIDIISTDLLRKIDK